MSSRNDSDLSRKKILGKTVELLSRRSCGRCSGQDCEYTGICYLDVAVTALKEMIDGLEPSAITCADALYLAIRGLRTWVSHGKAVEPTEAETHGLIEDLYSMVRNLDSKECVYPEFTETDIEHEPVPDVAPYEMDIIR